MKNESLTENKSIYASQKQEGRTLHISSICAYILDEVTDTRYYPRNSSGYYEIYLSTDVCKCLCATLV